MNLIKRQIVWRMKQWIEEISMYISGTKNSTQQSYVIAKKLQGNKYPGIYYWIVPEHHTASSIANQLEIFFSYFQLPFSAFVLDPLDVSFTFVLSQLNKKTNGIYLMTETDYKQLPTSLGLLRDDQFLLKVGDRFEPQSFVKKLVDRGYSNDDESLFSFSAKGGSVTLQMLGSVYRLSFNEEGVEQIKQLDGQTRKDLSIIPATFEANAVPESFIDAPSGTFIAQDLYWKKIKFEYDNVLLFETFAKEGEVVNLVEPKQYKRDFDAMIEDLKMFDKKNYHILIAALDPLVIETACKKRGYVTDQLHLFVQEGALHGFVDEKEQFVLITHAEVFGRERKIKKQKRRNPNQLITELKEGEYVVHEDHGVARYLGLRTTVIEGHSRENLLLEYAKGDKLYVPVELAHKVDKYVGETKPALHRLSGTSWVRLSRKVTQESQVFAKDLLRIYAQRSLSEVDKWHIYSDADNQLHHSFGYTETPDQETAIKDVYHDLRQSTPMDRLIVGDVGFGKTEVALRASYQGVLNHKQVAILCPTTLLAQQHYDNFTERLAPLGVKVEMLSRFTGKTKSHTVSSKEIIKELGTGDVQVIIGTHRLLSEDIDFKQIGLVIIDEEQKFGVRHKERLKQLRPHVHVLTMSATPIPRTLYFALSGLRDISSITTPPKGRQPIDTFIEQYDEDIIKKAIDTELHRGGQVFYLYNEVRTMLSAKKRLQDILGSDVRLGMVHGQMPELEMAKITEDFDKGKIDVLICSTIIENGIDLPNVNTLIVEKATKLGLGQLYQLRGRIGRGKVKAYAHFLYRSEQLTGIAAKRLQILQEARELGSGMELATKDLELRGMGQMLGKKQHGNIQSVGLGMYGKLLRQAVEELETGEIVKASKTVSINLPLDYGIPDSIVPQPTDKVKLYRAISGCEEMTDLDDLMNPLLHKATTNVEKEQLQNFYKIIELKILAQGTPIEAIDYQEVRQLNGGKKQQLSIQFYQILSEYVQLLTPLLPDFRIVENSIIIDASEIEDYEKLIKSLINSIKGLNSDY